jgi:hypothetical protein
MMSLEEEFILLKRSKFFISLEIGAGILFLLLTSISFRVYLRTRLKTELIRTVIGFLFAISLFSFSFIPLQLARLYFIWLCVIGTSFIIVPLASSVLINGSEKYLAIWKETTFWQRFVGNIPPLSGKYDYITAKKWDFIGAIICIIYFFILLFLEKRGYHNFYTLILKWPLLFLGIVILGKHLFSKIFSQKKKK